MDIQVKHSGVDITSHVIRYDREQKVCSGIGMLEVEIEYTYGGTFDPWDVIDIYENSVHAGKYYVSSVAEGQPSATFIVSAQDNSKRLSDYFITDTYLINYPSYTRYWIELFLTEAGISFSFLTTSQGSLLSNNTSLGLMSAYEQVLMLLQMSGWYIRFNSSGRAIIGKLDADKAKNRGTLNNTDIIEIKVDKNDRMYRNRVVVWGTGDPATSRWVFADVRKPTKWDYDSRDLRTILISNSNIPTVADAFMLANKALTEFARLNIEKYLTVEDARNISVGDVVSIRTKVFSGKAMVTTFGVSMSKAGLVSNIACDERCPRLFGFFNPGGYVYVGTFGSGVWRKHILDYERNGIPSGTVLSGLAENVYSGGWFDYSSGLQDMNVTDLHVNNGVLASVTSSGQIYYSLEDMTPWSGIVLSGLQVTYSGTMVDSTVYSGLMGRACIIDRDTNFLRYAVDTGSGINLGDFLMETATAQSGIFQYSLSGVTASGIAVSGNSWILDVNPYDGIMVNAYPVWTSGGAGVSGVNYNYTVYDIENDGSNDYVEALTYGSGGLPQDIIIGAYNSNIGYSTDAILRAGLFDFSSGGYEDPDFYTYTNYSGYPTPLLQNNTTFGNTTTITDFQGGFGLYVDSDVKAYTQYSQNSTGTRRVVVRRYDSTASSTTVSTAINTSYDFNKTFPLSTRRLSSSQYRFYFRKSSSVTNLGKDLLIVDLTITNPSTGAGTITETVIADCLQDSTDTLSNVLFSTLVMGTSLYSVKCVNDGISGDVYVDLYKTDLDTGTEEHRRILEKEHFGVFPGDGTYIYTNPVAFLSCYGETDVQVVVTYEYRRAIQPGNFFYYVARRYAQRGFSGSGSDSELYDWSAVNGAFYLGGFNGPEIDLHAMFPLTYKQTCFSYRVWSSVVGDEVRFKDFFDLIDDSSSFPGAQFSGNSDTECIGGVGGGVFKLFSPLNGAELSTIPVPTGYTLRSFSGKDSFNGDLIFHAKNDTLNTYEVVWMTREGTITRRQASVIGDTDCRVVGTFRVTLEALSGATPTPSIKWIQPEEILGYFPTYLVLQRDGWDFNVVKSGYMRDRLDISNYSPLVTMDRRISSTETYFISQDGEVSTTSHVAMSGYNLGPDSASGQIFTLGVTADDFRYSDFEDTTESGTSRRLFVVYSGGVGSIDLWTLDSFSGEFQSPSGYAKRVEVSNYSLPDQFVFVAVSGYTTTSGEWGFFQKSPSVSGYDMTSSGVFVDYSSGYPQARTTIVRLDDSL